MKPKQHAGVRRSPVPGKICLPYVTGHRQQQPGKTGKLKSWIHEDTKKKFRPKRAEKKLYEFLLDVYRGKHSTKGWIYPAPPGEAEAYAKKTFSLITRGCIGTWDMCHLADEFEEWWKGQAKYVKEDGKWSEKREKGEKHRRAGKNWKKALAAKPLWNKQDQKKYQAWLAPLSR